MLKESYKATNSKMSDYTKLLGQLRFITAISQNRLFRHIKRSLDSVRLFGRCELECTVIAHAKGDTGRCTVIFYS